jgi:hypothetical protein
MDLCEIAWHFNTGNLLRVLRLAVTAKFVSSSPNVVTLIMEEMRSSKTLVLTGTTSRNMELLFRLQPYTFLSFEAKCAFHWTLRLRKSLSIILG